MQKMGNGVLLDPLGVRGIDLLVGPLSGHMDQRFGLPVVFRAEGPASCAEPQVVNGAGDAQERSPGDGCQSAPARPRPRTPLRLPAEARGGCPLR